MEKRLLIIVTWLLRKLPGSSARWNVLLCLLSFNAALLWSGLYRQAWPLLSGKTHESLLGVCSDCLIKRFSGKGVSHYSDGCPETVDHLLSSLSYALPALGPFIQILSKSPWTPIKVQKYLSNNHPSLMSSVVKKGLNSYVHVTFLFFFSF